MKNPVRKFAPVAAAGILTLALAACGSTGSSANGSGGGDDASANLDGRGPITYVQGKDNNNVVRPLIAKWNAAHPDEKVTLKEHSDDGDAPHADFVQNFQAKNADYDVVSVDVIWTAEFAAKGWLQPLKDKLAIDTSPMLPATVKAATYKNTLYAAPMNGDAGILYYRKDLVPTPPKTWDEMMADCKIAAAHKIGCYAGQYAKSEGLTVNTTEAINTAGGTVIGPDGKPTLNTPEAKAGLQNLVTAYSNGNIPKEAITFQEEQGRQAFEDGKLMFLRNWPYAYSLAKTDGASKVKDSFGIAPLPGKDGPGASTLGGHSAGISVYSKHKATAHDFLAFLTTAESQKFFATQASFAPVLTSLYEDKDLVAKLPYLPVLKTAIQNAVPRPVTPFYPAVTAAIQDNAYAAIKGEKSVDAALNDMSNAISTAGSQ